MVIPVIVIARFKPCIIRITHVILSLVCSSIIILVRCTVLIWLENNNALFAYEGDTLIKWRPSIRGQGCSERWIRSTLGDLLSNIEPGSVDSWTVSNTICWTVSLLGIKAISLEFRKKHVSLFSCLQHSFFPAASKGTWFLVNGRLIWSIPETLTQANFFGP